MSRHDIADIWLHSSQDTNNIIADRWPLVSGLRFDRAVCVTAHPSSFDIVVRYDQQSEKQAEVGLLQKDQKD